MGEVMNWTYAYSGFTSDFKRNETYDYSVTLLPEMCSNPSYTDVVTEATASDFGHTTHTCKHVATHIQTLTQYMSIRLTITVL